MSLASKAIERVLCGVVGHLCGDVPTSTASRGGLAPSRRTFDVESYRRWQRCLSICRKALGSDVIFLALLLHSGSLWGIDYDGIEWRLQDLCAAPLAKVRAGTSISAANNNLSNHSGAPSPSVDDGPVLDADDSLHIYRQLMQEDSANMWALLVITFLNVVEFYERGVDEVSARQRRGYPPHPSMARTTSADGVASPVSGDGLCAPTASMESSGGSDEDEGSSSASSTMPPPRPGKTPKFGERRRRRPLGSHAPSSTHKANRNTHHGSSSPPMTGAGDASVGVSVEVLRELRLHGVASALMASPTMAGGRRSGGFEDASAESTHVVEDDVWMATVTITDEDEPLVQRVAALLADRFFHLFSIQGAGGEEVKVEDLVKMMEQNDDDDGSLQQEQQQQKRVDPDIVRSWRDYLFSTAVKMAAYVDGTSSMLLEENVHLQAIIARHDLHARRIDEVFHASIPSIVSCFLAEEAAARSFVVSPAPWLCLPAPVYFLPFHVVGCGSRVAAWLPTELNKCRSSTTSSRVMMGELLSCQVTSLSWQVGTASFTSTTCTPPLPKYKIAAGLGIGLQWLDEQHTHGGRNELQRSVDALMPRMDAAQHTQHLHDAAPPSSSRRRLGTSATRGEPQSPWRWWCSSEAQLHAYLRVDAAAPRHLFMRAIPAKDKHDLTESSSRTHGAAAHRRRRAAENGLRLESLVCLYGQRHSPVGVRVAAMVERVCSGGSRGNTAGRATPASSCTTSAGGGEGYSRTSLKRDALAAIITYMHLASRRLIAMRRPAALGERRRGNAAHGESSADVMMAMMMGMGGGLTAGGKGAGEDVVGGVAPASPGSRTSSSAIPSLNQMSADQEVATVLEAAVVLSSMALLLTHSMADQIADVPAWMLWTVEVGSFVMDCSLATPRPLPRLLKAAGFVLVLLPNPPQALLLAVGLLATLGARQLQSIRGIAPSSWWNVFEAVVLRDDSIPGLLCPGTWELVRNVEASLSAGLAKVQARRSSASAAANHTSQRTLTSKTMLRLTAPTVGDAASSPSSSSSKPSSSTRRRLLLAMPTPSSDAAPTGGRRGRKPANTNIAAASATSSPHKSAAATFSAAPPAAAEVATTEELTQDVLDDGPLIGDDVVGGVPTLSVIKSFAACHDVVVAHGEENAITDGLAPINHHKRLRHDERADDAEMMLMADYSAAVVALWASLKGAYHNYVQQIHI